MIFNFVDLAGDYWAEGDYWTESDPGSLEMFAKSAPAVA